MLARHGAFAVLLTLLAAFYFWLTTHDGVGSLNGDGLIYLGAARHYAWYWPVDGIAGYWARTMQFPPLYPALLAVTGGAAGYGTAHAVTAAFLVAAFVATYGWLCSIGIARARAAAATALLALAPGTFMQSFYLYPEGLYVALVFAALVALARGERGGGPAAYWVASAAVALAILARTVGVALLPALAVALVRSRPRGWPAMALLAIVPAIAWSIAHRPPWSYSDALEDLYLGGQPAAIAAAIAEQAQAAATGLVRNIGQNPRLAWLAAPLLLAVGAVALWRFARWRPDAWYFLAYLAALALWPYPGEAVRLAWVVVPVALGYLVWGGERLAARAAPVLGASVPALRWAPVAVVALAVLPEFALLAGRALHPLARDTPGYRHLAQWYEPDLARARYLTEVHLRLAESLPAFAAEVPATECVLSSVPQVVSFFMGRSSRNLPPESADDAVFESALRDSGCRYAVFAAATARGESAFYPYQRLGGRVVILGEAYARLEGEPLVASLGMLTAPDPAPDGSRSAQR